MTFSSSRKFSADSSNRNASTASIARPTPATTPYRRPSGSLRANSSKTLRRNAVFERNAARIIVSSYWSVSSAVLGAPDVGAVRTVMGSA